MAKGKRTGKKKIKNPEVMGAGKQHLSGMYQNWFLDYASYVILERAVPYIEDGLKPVQRRILFAMKQMDDGRYNKVANIIGQTMQYHPHGDASIEDALVNIGQKDLLVDCQGNWGDVRTGDRAAAARYIEARPSKFAHEVAFNPKTTEWQVSYDGRKKEPIALPMKFPLLLFQGVEGIAVGLSTKILPHNFCELLKGSIKILEGKKTKLIPDFAVGGAIDPSEYNRGKRGGRVKVRCSIEIVDKKTLAIRDIPYGTTTHSLIDSIVKANEKGKIKIKKITDNTAKDVEILIDLGSGVSPELTVEALYAFTNCQISISPNACVIVDEKPVFLTVDDLLQNSTKHTVALLKLELEIRLKDLQEKWHMSSLEKIFIEKRIYRKIEECTTWESVISTIDKGLSPYKKLFKRKITEEDIVKLTEIKIKRISKFDSFKADELINRLDEDMKATKKNLKGLTKYAIDYFQHLLDKYGKGRERKTRIESFEEINTKMVVAATEKIYMNRADGFVGTGLRKDEFIGECSMMDDVIAIRKDGKMQVSKVSKKTFMGKGILYAAIWKKGDDRMVYHMIYADPDNKKNYVKRFNVKGVTRDKEYSLTKSDKKAKVHFLSANPNGESEVVEIKLSPSCRAHKKTFDFDFSSIGVKGRASKGNTLTKWPIRKVSLLEKGKSTIGGVEISYDENTGKLSTDGVGDFLGEFNTGDLILVVLKNGSYMLTTFELSNRYPYQEVEIIEQFDPRRPITCIYHNATKKEAYIKRFLIETTSLNTKVLFVPETKGTKVLYLNSHVDPAADLHFVKGKAKKVVVEETFLNDLIEIKGYRAMGNRLSTNKLKKVELLESEEPDEKEWPEALIELHEPESGGVVDDEDDDEDGGQTMEIDFDIEDVR